MKKICLVVSISMLLWACKKKNTYYFLSNNLEGLSTKSPVIVSGLTIGSVKDLKLLNNGVILGEISIEKGINIPRGSKFKIAALGMLGSKMLDIEMTSNQDYYLSGDTIPLNDVINKGFLESIIGENPENLRKADSIVQIINRAFDDVSNVMIRDSLKIDSTQNR